MKHILTALQFTRAEIDALFVSAEAMSKFQPRRNLWIMASLFFQPSTRTRLSFEAAAVRMSGHLLTVEDGSQNSSMKKGESLEDTIRTVSQYADLIVLRHPERGAAERAATVSNVSVINAGDGIGHHPSQALLDAYTIMREKGTVDGNKVLIWGDTEHARTINSFMDILNQYDVEITLRDLSEKIEDSLVEQADVIYMTRPQSEYLNRTDEQRYYGLEARMLPMMKQDTIIMHPLPRALEVSDEVAQDDRAVFFRQIKYGVEMRMALLHEVLG